MRRSRFAGITDWMAWRRGPEVEGEIIAPSQPHGWIEGCAGVQHVSPVGRTALYLGLHSNGF